MAWQRKYWDILDQLYWTPKYLGLESISKKEWEKRDELVCVPADRINNSGPLYTRRRKWDEMLGYLQRQEEVLNHMFDLTFAIASDDVLKQLFCDPLVFDDRGPFESLGREVQERYGWGRQENVTQQDGLFVSPTSVIGIELKLGSSSWPEQIAKYASLVLWEELTYGQRVNIGLVFVVPENSLPNHWESCGLIDSEIDASFIETLKIEKLPSRIRSLLLEHEASFRSVFDRMNLATITWSELRLEILRIEETLDNLSAGDQTLLRLLRGFREQIEEHNGTGI